MPSAPTTMPLPPSQRAYCWLCAAVHFVDDVGLLQFFAAAYYHRPCACSSPPPPPLYLGWLDWFRLVGRTWWLPRGGSAARCGIVRTPILLDSVLHTPTTLPPRDMPPRLNLPPHAPFPAYTPTPPAFRFIFPLPAARSHRDPACTAPAVCYHTCHILPRSPLRISAVLHSYASPSRSYL